MIRPSKLIAALVLTATLGFSPLATAAPPDGDSQSTEEAFNELSTAQQDELRKAAELQAQGKKLSNWQLTALVQGARQAKERILSSEIVRSERLARREAGIGMNAIINTMGSRIVSPIK